MFGGRKLKVQEDEPLVPHGLVWQATAEPEAAPEGNTPVGLQANAQGKLVEMPQPPTGADVEAKGCPSPLFPLGRSLHGKTIASAPPVEPPSEAPVPRKPVVASPPEFWKSVKRPELVKTS